MTATKLIRWLWSHGAPYAQHTKSLHTIPMTKIPYWFPSWKHPHFLTHYITLHPPFNTPSFLFIYNNFRDTLNRIFNFCSFIQLSVIDAFYLYRLFTFVNYLLFRKLTSYKIWCENIHVCSICFTTSICYLKK